MTAALEGVTVLELTRVAPGAYATMILGDMGAQVIKIETPPQAGQPTGSGVSGGKEEVRRAVTNFTNRNKRSIAINLKESQGQAILQKLASTADVLVEGFRPGVMERLGGGYEALKKLNPRIIYCSMSGYGRDGPYRDLPGHDINYISIGGALGLIGEPGRLPAIPLNIVADYAAASYHAVMGILLALLARDRTGKGQFVDVSYLDGVVSLTAATPPAWGYFREGVVPKRGEMALSGVYPYYGVYECQGGGLISLGNMEPWLWENFCKALGREDLTQYHFVPQHFAQKPAPKYRKVVQELKKLFLTRTRDQWFEFLSKHDVCVGKVYDLDEVFRDPQVRHREMVLEMEDPRVGKFPQVGISIKLSETPGKVRSLGPYLGENTDQVLRGLSYQPREIEELRRKGVVA